MAFNMTPNSGAGLLPAGNIYATGSMLGPNGIHQILSKPINTTRVLKLSDFSPELKTKDLVQVFAFAEDLGGGYRIKWIDDQSAYVVFQDPTVAKKAFLATLSNLPPSLSATVTSPAARLEPYAGADVDQIIASVANRPRSRSNAGNGHTHTRRQSSISNNNFAASFNNNNSSNNHAAHSPSASFAVLEDPSQSPQQQQQHLRTGSATSMHAAREAAARHMVGALRKSASTDQHQSQPGSSPQTSPSAAAIAA